MHVLSMPHMTLFILLTIQCHHYPHFRWRKQKFSGGNNLPTGTAVKGAAPLTPTLPASLRIVTIHWDLTMCTALMGAPQTLQKQTE